MRCRSAHNARVRSLQSSSHVERCKWLPSEPAKLQVPQIVSSFDQTAHRLLYSLAHLPDLERLIAVRASEVALLRRQAGSTAARPWRVLAPPLLPDKPTQTRRSLSGNQDVGCGNKRPRMFNPRQLLGLELSCRLIAEIEDQRIRHALATNLSRSVALPETCCAATMTMALKSLDIFSVHGFPVGLVQCESNLLSIVNGAGANVGSGGCGPSSSTSTSRRSAIARRRSKSGATARATSGFRSRASGSARSSTAAAARSPSVARARPGAGSPHEALDAVFTDPPCNYPRRGAHHRPEYPHEAGGSAAEKRGRYGTAYQCTGCRAPGRGQGPRGRMRRHGTAYQCTGCRCLPHPRIRCSGSLSRSSPQIRQGRYQSRPSPAFNHWRIWASLTPSCFTSACAKGRLVDVVAILLADQPEGPDAGGGSLRLRIFAPDAAPP